MFKRPKGPMPGNWWAKFNLKVNPYIYGPMPWKRTSIRWRREEASRGVRMWIWKDEMTADRYGVF